MVEGQERLQVEVFWGEAPRVSQNRRVGRSSGDWVCVDTHDPDPL
jgi:hypothetical protein